MSQHLVSIAAADGTVLAGFYWPCTDARAHIHIAHGLAEHGARYQRLATYLNALGYSVSASDHRGHGQTAQANRQPLGYPGVSDSWRVMVKDLERWWQHCSETFCTAGSQGRARLPLIALGHSMGSFMTLAAASQTTQVLAAMVLVASGVRSRWMSQLQSQLIRVIPRVPGLSYQDQGVDKSNLVEWLGFGAFNRRFAPARTAFDWLSRNEAEVDAYMNDPDCGRPTSLQLWSDLLNGVAQLQKTQVLRGISADLPVLLLSGTRDPVGDDGTGAPKLAQRLRRSGVKDVQVRLFAGARHELLNESNADEVFAALADWLAQKLQRIS